MSTGAFGQYARWAPVIRSALSITARSAVAIKVIQELVVSIDLSVGPSMLPTIHAQDDWLLHVPLPMYRMIARFLPDSVAPTFHDAKHAQATSRSFGNHVGGPRGKLDPAMATGLAVGDLVVLTSPIDAKKQACKRIIGLAGDTVLLDPLVEAHARHALTWGAPQALASSGTIGIDDDEPKYIVVPPGHVWVLGDNLAASRDSRHYGPVPLGLVHGRVLAKVFPWQDAQWLRNTLHQLQ